MTRPFVCLRSLLVGLCVALSPAVGLAQDYPSRPVRIIVPFPPGGAADLLARLMAQSMSDSMGKSIVTENRPGGATIIAADLTAKSPPDGYTLLMAVDSTLTMNQSLYSKLPYDPVKDFAPVTLLAEQPLLLSANPNAPFKSVKELVDYAKANPGTVNIGIGALVSRVAAELLKLMTGADMTIIPYSGSAPSRQALLAGDVQAAFSDVASPAPFIKEGRMRALATTGPKRALRDVPTVAEAGLPGYEVKSWYALVAPAGTPPPIIERLNAEVTKALQSASLKNRLGDLGLELAPGSPEQLANLIQTDTVKWGKLIKATGMKVD
jgi:tripartite-type tricarboxylate transporter receptor subunit TctC